MLPNTIALSSTLPRVKNKTYNQNDEHIPYSKSVDFQKMRQSWPLGQVVECVALETVSNISSESENETYSVDPILVHNGCVTVLQTDDFQTGCIKELGENSPTNNVLKIVLPLVNENVPLNCEPKIIEHDDFLQKQSHVMSSNMYVQCSPNGNDSDMTVKFTNKSFNNRNNSLPEDGETNRFSSTFENIKALLKEGLVDGLDEMPPDFQPPIPPLLYRVSSLPNLLSHDNTKHHSCSYLTMCATKQELLMNKFCKNIAKHDMSVQVSTELLKHQTEKILVNTSCQTDDIFVNGLQNDEETKEINYNAIQTSSSVANKECGVSFIDKNEMKNNIDKESNSIGCTYINTFNKENKLEINTEKNCFDVDYTIITSLNEDQKLNINKENECSSMGYTNINVFSADSKMKAIEEDDCNIYDYSDVNVYSRVSKDNEDCTSIGYTNINVFNDTEVKTNTEDFCANVSYTDITTFNEPSGLKYNSKKGTNIDYKILNVVEKSDEIKDENEHPTEIGYININELDKKLREKTNGEDCVDIGFKTFCTYDKRLGLNGDCKNYTNADILEEFVNEQLSLNNADGDFDSFLFGPLPPSPIEEIVSELPLMNDVETKRENTAPVPFMFDTYKNKPSTSIIKSRSIDAEFSHNFQQHQKIGTRSVQSERRTYPSEVPTSDGYLKPLKPKTNIHPSTIEKLSDISSSLPDTPLLGRCDFPRQYSATGTKTMAQMSNSLSINMRGAGHGSSIGLGQAMAGAELLHLNGPGRGWYPRQRQFRPVSVEQLDKLASKSPVGHSQWDSRESHKPVTLPPNLTPKFFNRSPREALRRVTSLLIRKGNTNKSNKSKTVFSSSVIGPHGDISEDCVTSQSKRSFFKSLWRK